MIGRALQTIRRLHCPPCCRKETASCRNSDDRRLRRCRRAPRRGTAGRWLAGPWPASLGGRLAAGILPVAGDLQAPECPAVAERAARLPGVQRRRQSARRGWLPCRLRRRPAPCAGLVAGPRPAAQAPAVRLQHRGLRADRWRLDRRVAGAFPGLFRTDHARRRAGRAGQRDTGYPRAPGRHLRSGAGMAAQPGAPGLPGGQRAAAVCQPDPRRRCGRAAGLPVARRCRRPGAGGLLHRCRRRARGDARGGRLPAPAPGRQPMGRRTFGTPRRRKRCSNRRARALGWVPRYPSYREGYAAVLGDA